MRTRLIAAAVLLAGLFVGVAGSAGPASAGSGAPGFVVVHETMKCHSVADHRAIG